MKKTETLISVFYILFMIFVIFSAIKTKEILYISIAIWVFNSFIMFRTNINNRTSYEESIEFRDRIIKILQEELNNKKENKDEFIQ